METSAWTQLRAVAVEEYQSPRAVDQQRLQQAQKEVAGHLGSTTASVRSENWSSKPKVQHAEAHPTPTVRIPLDIYK